MPHPLTAGVHRISTRWPGLFKAASRGQIRLIDAIDYTLRRQTTHRSQH